MLWHTKPTFPEDDGTSVTATGTYVSAWKWRVSIATRTENSQDPGDHLDPLGSSDDAASYSSRGKFRLCLLELRRGTA